jgi:hypothetical protein
LVVVILEVVAEGVVGLQEQRHETTIQPVAEFLE